MSKVFKPSCFSINAVRSSGTIFVVLLSACNPLVSTPTTQAGFNPGIDQTPSTQSFSQTFNLNSTTQANYSIGSSTIDFTVNSCELTSASQTDNATNAFAGGSLVGVAWDSTNHYLRIDNHGGCDGTQSNCDPDDEVNANWAPDSSNLILVSHLNGSGSIADGTSIASSVGPNGMATNTSGTGMSYMPAKLSQGAALNGVDNAIVYPLGITAAVSEYAVSLWFYVPVGSTSGTIFGTGPKIGCTPSTVSVSLDSNGGVQFQQCGAFYNSGAATYQQGQWNHLVVSLNAGLYTLYLNGISAASGINISTGDTTNLQYLSLGGGYGGGVIGNFLRVSIDELSVWNSHLTDDDVRALYNRQNTHHAGVLTSRVIDSLSSDASWTSLSWVPTLPFFKALPDGVSNPVPGATPFAQNETTANYTGLDSSHLMDGNVGLWHLDEPSGTNSAGSLADQSGNGNVGSPYGSVSFGNIGVLGTSATLNGSNYIGLGSDASLSPTSALTVSAWVNQSYNNNFQVVLSQESQTGYQLGVYGGNAYFAIKTSNNGWLGTSASASASIGSNTWAHISGTYDGTTCRIYVNGKLVSSDQVSASGSLEYGLNSVYLGAISGNSSFFYGSVDEAAIWSRALSANEILELYRRGANRIKYQVQTCQHAADCTNSPNWQGPDGTNQTYFSELDNTTAYDKVNNVPSGSVNAGLPNMTFSNFAGTPPAANRYFQYRTILESDDTSTNCNYDGTGVPNTWCSPELKSVAVGPGHYENGTNTVTNSIGQSYVTLSSFAETLGTGGCTSTVVYNLSKDNVIWYYWNGTAWDNNVSLAHANAASVINSHIASFATQLGAGTLYFKAYLQSSVDGTSSCALSGVSVGGTK
jgi:hypothetical protein